MFLASRLCVLVVVFWQGSALAQGAKLLSTKLPLWQQGLTVRPASFGNKLLLDFDAQNTSTAKPQESRLRPRLYWSVGLALAAGGAAWWSGREADRAYDRYLHSASFQRQDEQFRRAERYDRFAGGAFVFMEAGIVLTTYLVFF